MSRRIGPGWLTAVAVAMVFTLVTSSIGSSDSIPLGAQEKRGRQIYLKGTSAAGRQILAFVGKGDIEAPASVMPCINCHSRSGEGLVESGIAATDISWRELTKAYGLKRHRGREHPAYTVESLARAITDGVDPGRNELDVTMPRYRMAGEDLNDLIAFIQRLGTIMDPGVREAELRIATLLPLTGRLRELGHAVKALMEAHLREINDRGGVFGRKIELLVLDYGEDGKTGFAGLKKLVEDEEVFGLVSPLISSFDAEAISWAEEEEVPFIGPMTARTESATVLNRYTFFIFSGLKEQALALVAFLGESRFGEDEHRLAIVAPESELSHQLADAAAEQAAKQGWGVPARFFYRPGAAAGSEVTHGILEGRHGAVLFFGNQEELETLLKGLEQAKVLPAILWIGSQVRGDLHGIPTGFGGRIFSAHATLPSDQSDRGRMRLARLMELHNVPRNHLPAQISAYAALELLVAGLERSGRDLTREKLVSVLERVHDFETGLTPRLTFEPNRRVGALGAHIVPVDLNKPTSIGEAHWVPLE